MRGADLRGRTAVPTGFVGDTITKEAVRHDADLLAKESARFHALLALVSACVAPSLETVKRHLVTTFVLAVMAGIAKAFDFLSSSSAVNKR